MLHTEAQVHLIKDDSGHLFVYNKKYIEMPSAGDLACNIEVQLFQLASGFECASIKINKKALHFYLTLIKQ